MCRCWVLQVEAVQLRQKVTVAGELTGTAEEIARERDELRREMEERKDEHTLVRNDLPLPFLPRKWWPCPCVFAHGSRLLLGKCSQPIHAHALSVLV